MMHTRTFRERKFIDFDPSLGRTDFGEFTSELVYILHELFNLIYLMLPLLDYKITTAYIHVRPENGAVFDRLQNLRMIK